MSGLIGKIDGQLTYGEYSAVYNALSFVIASMGASTVFFYLQLPQLHEKYRTALICTGLVTFIACYHYFRIFNSFVEAFDVSNVFMANGSVGVVKMTGVPFNDAYRYMDWLLTVPLLLMELVFVMGFKETSQTVKYSTILGSLAALMIILGYPGEIADSLVTRWIFWALAMLPFLAIVVVLFFMLNKSIQQQAQDYNETVKNLVSAARYVTVISWSTYPIVYILGSVGLSGSTGFVGVQIGYSVADVISKCGYGVMIWYIAASKSQVEKARSKDGLLVDGHADGH